MKKLIFLISFTISSFCWSQEANDFKIENNQVIWQKVYENKNDSFKNNIKTKISRIISETENQLIAEINNIQHDYKSLGISEISCPIYISRTNTKATLILDIKENRYRVTLKNITLVQLYTDTLSEQGEINYLENFALKNNNTKFKNSFLKKPGTILNYSYSKIFKESNKTDNW